MNLLNELKKIPVEEQSLPVFLRMSTLVGNIRDVDVVSSKIFKDKKTSEFIQVLSIRNSDFDCDYANYFFDANGLDVEYDDEEEEYEHLEISSQKSVKLLISSIEENLSSDVSKVLYSAKTAIVGDEYKLNAINKDVYYMFGCPNDCFIIEVGK